MEIHSLNNSQKGEGGGGSILNFLEAWFIPNLHCWLFHVGLLMNPKHKAEPPGPYM